MYFEDDYVGGEREDRRRRRVRLICECREVRGERDDHCDHDRDRRRDRDFECRCRERRDDRY
ncbi:hypothetical protein [Lederbergia lenta]|uniref:Uncharacterized protein n=1 Tax=Lederbergia lenta TaxID=1467 RepID=A0A2X4ZJV5_LEDLE|nr:hypothetical protein [Lederbergia lenta]MEC2324050.1 hypothetical protein [Lederbergia lenta]SQI60734.1 Uncharacterised protein [Lederbergia lenta]